MMGAGLYINLGVRAYEPGCGLITPFVPRKAPLRGSENLVGVHDRLTAIRSANQPRGTSSSMRPARN